MIESQIVARVLPSKCREAVKVLLQEVYGYEDFRNLEVYDDLFRGKEKLQLSQGQLIEEVIMEAEKGIKGDSSAHNLLLTAPTGAGKSLLFQLPAIYLGNEYKLLTLVVSPLKALIVDQVEALRELGYERVWRMLRPIFHLNKRTKYIVVSVKGRLIFFIFPLNYCWRMISVIL